MCATLLASCGGAGGGKSGLKTNDYLGSLPALYADHAAELEAIEEKTNAQAEKLMSGGEGNYDKIQPLYDKASEQTEKLKEQFKADVAAELGKLTGKAIPITFSEGLKSSGMDFYDVADVKLVERRGEALISLNIKAKADFTAPGMQGYDYGVYYRIQTADGAVEKLTGVILPVSLERTSQSFAAGQLLKEATLPLNLSSNAAKLAGFTGIEFISKAEYNQ